MAGVGFGRRPLRVRLDRVTRRFPAGALTRDAQTSAGNGGHAVSCELRTTTGGIQAGWIPRCSSSLPSWLRSCSSVPLPTRRRRLRSAPFFGAPHKDEARVVAGLLRSTIGAGWTGVEEPAPLPNEGPSLKFRGRRFGPNICVCTRLVYRDRADAEVSPGAWP